LKKIIIIIILIIIVGGAFFTYNQIIKRGLSPIANIPTATVKKGPFEITISTIGTLDAAVKKNVTSDFGG
jgi:multidrug efflux pump subunit AcrA (membrane-fusion protein)